MTIYRHHYDWIWKAHLVTCLLLVLWQNELTITVYGLTGLLFGGVSLYGIVNHYRTHRPLKP